MADLKISQLTGASTPLAGTEVLPIVQSSSTVKVSVADLTAGRAVGMLSNTINANTVVPSAGSITGTNLWAIGANATNNTVLLDAFGSNSLIAFRRASGTAAAPTAVTTGSTIMNIGARGYGATGYSSGNRASMNMTAAETWTDTAQGTRIAFNTTAIGSTTLTERMSVENTGNVNVTNGNLVVSTANKAIEFAGNGSVLWRCGAGTPEGAVTAPVGSLFTRTDGGLLSTLYVKESGTGNTGWVAK